MISTKERKYLFSIGDVIKDLVVTDFKLYKRNNGKTEKGYMTKCLKCGSEFHKLETDLRNNRGCRYCSGNRHIKAGINDLATTRPDLVKYFKDKSDTEKYSYGSEKTVDMICPQCGFDKRCKILNVSTFGFACPRCGDGFSYPNKFMFNLLAQLNIEFETEYSPDWISPKRYDFYIPSLKLIVEMDGGWHNTNNNLSGKSKKEIHELDEMKDRLATSHGLKVIRVDSCISSMRYIQDGVINSILPNMLKEINIDISLVDWLLCHEFSCSTRVKEACDLWMSGISSCVEISKVMKCERTSVYESLKKGAIIGWCDYNAGQVNRENSYKSGKMRAKKVYFVETDKVFESVVHLSDISESVCGTQLTKTGIARVCRGERKHHKGFHFKYIEE